jgi:hypothetical protein
MLSCPHEQIGGNVHENEVDHLNSLILGKRVELANIRSKG